jgi:hypothetical protein
MGSSIVLAALTVLGLIACTKSSASFYQHAAVADANGTVRIVAGEKAVLQRCWQHTEPFPDAFSSYCLVVPLDQSQVRSGAIVFIGPASNSAWLWQANGPSRHLTQAVEGELHILSVKQDTICVALAAHTAAGVPTRWRWTFEGKERYRLESLPRQD